MIALDYELDTSTAAGDLAADALMEVGNWSAAASPTARARAERDTCRRRRAEPRVGARRP